MTNPVPLTPVPAHYTHGDWRTGKPRGVHYPGDTVVVPLDAVCGATAYSVQWWNAPNGTFDVVSSASLVGTETSVAPAVPAGGWKMGWYRIFLTGPTNDLVFGFSYSVNCFGFIRSNSSFPTLDGVFPGPPDFTAGWDVTMKGQLGIGTSRLQVDNVYAPTTGIFKLADMVSFVQNYFAPYWTTAAAQYLDAARPRYLFCQLGPETGTVDSIPINATSSTYYVWCYCKDASLDGSLLTVTVTSSSGTACTITVKYNGSTVETWNVTSAANAVTQINGGSSYLRVFVNSAFSPGSNPVNMSATPIGNGFFNGVADCVSQLYAVGVTRFEGPRNEPSGFSGAEVAQQMKLFQAAVHQDNASAKAIGPSFVQIRTDASTDEWESFLAAGGGAYCDELATHAYNGIINGALTCGRTNCARWVALLARYGIDALPRWVTEGNGTSTALDSVHHPRRAARGLLLTLIWEEHGVPRERNPYWYDMSHGYWADEDWLANQDSSLTPTAFLLHTLAEETRGMNYQALYTLPSTAEKLLLAQHYSGSGGGCAIFQLGSWMPGATVIVATSQSSLTVIDGFGNESTVAVSGGQATIALSDCPTYVRIPTGATLNVVTVNGWPTTERTLLDSSQSVTLSGTRTLTPVSGQWLYSWDRWAASYPDGGGMVAGTAGMPDTYVHKLAAAKPVRRALVFAGIVWQKAGTLLTFTVDYSTDGGSNWTNVPGATVNRSATATTTLAGADVWNTATQLETPYGDDYIFDVDLGATISLNAIRLSVSAATYGGEPNSAAYAVNGNDTGWSTPQIVLQQVVLRG